MKAKFKMGDVVGTNDLYRRQGEMYFGRDLKHRNFVGKILAVHENTNDERDGHGDVWQNVYVFKNDISICEPFLKKINI